MINLTTMLIILLIGVGFMIPVSIMLLLRFVFIEVRENTFPVKQTLIVLLVPVVYAILAVAGKFMLGG